MNKLLLLLLLLFSLRVEYIYADAVGKEYMILVNSQLVKDPAWNQVVEALKDKHDGAVVARYAKSPREVLKKLQKYRPRYVAVVEKPEHLNTAFVIDLSCLSREVDDDIFADFLWGIITGYDAENALKMVNNSTEPLVVKDAIATITELNSAKWFDRYAWVDDFVPGLSGEKKGKNEEIQVTQGKLDLLERFTDFYDRYDPDLVVTASHATENNLEMPFSQGNIMGKNGKLYATVNGKNWDLREDGKRKVYFAVGNCLIGNVNNTRESMAIAWMKGGNAATMIGYVVTTWHGRNGWGGLKYWLTNPGRYTLAEAIYLNQQDFLYQQNQWYPSLLKKNYHGVGDVRKVLREALGKEPTKDQIGFWHDRDVLAYYGDPKWEVRLQEIPEENDFTVTSAVQGNKCVITITTKENFSLERMKGDHFKQEHVLDLPFSYFFPERLKHPRLAAGQQWDAVVDENFLLINNPDFKPGMTYEVVLELE